jgi:hypothetical protein
MQVTSKQRAALGFIASNPGASVRDIAAAAGASTSGDNAASFIARMIDAGLIQAVLTAEAADALEDGAI